MWKTLISTTFSRTASPGTTLKVSRAATGYLSFRTMATSSDVPKDTVNIMDLGTISDPQTATQPLVMQLVVRRDLLEAEGWGVGPLMAQTAHATAAVLHETRERPETIEYLNDLLTMRKAVLQTPSGAALEKLATALSSADPPIPHHLWIEQPENVPTCLALAPNRREKPIKKALDKSGCRLWKD